MSFIKNGGNIRYLIGSLSQKKWEICGRVSFPPRFSTPLFLPSSSPCMDPVGGGDAFGVSQHILVQFWSHKRCPLLGYPQTLSGQFFLASSHGSQGAIWSKPLCFPSQPRQWGGGGRAGHPRPEATTRNAVEANWLLCNGHVLVL